MFSLYRTIESWKPIHIEANDIIELVGHPIRQLTSCLGCIINKVALNILIQFAIAAPLFYLHGNLFVLGFVIGVIKSESVLDIIERVKLIFNEWIYKSRWRLVTVTAITPLLILQLPACMVVAALYYSAKFGALSHQMAKESHARAINFDIPAGGGMRGRLPANVFY